MTEYEKLQQIKKEAIATGIALVTLIIFWCFAGFFAAQFDVTIFHLPLWVITSSIGVWLFAILLVAILLRFFFKDMDLSEEGIS